MRSRDAVYNPFILIPMLTIVVFVNAKTLRDTQRIKNRLQPIPMYGNYMHFYTSWFPDMKQFFFIRDSLV